MLGVNIKSWNFDFFYLSKVVVDQILRLFGFMQIYAGMHPQGSADLRKCEFREIIQSLLPIVIVCSFVKGMHFSQTKNARLLN